MKRFLLIALTVLFIGCNMETKTALTTENSKSPTFYVATKNYSNMTHTGSYIQYMKNGKVIMEDLIREDPHQSCYSSVKKADVDEILIDVYDTSRTFNQPWNEPAPFYAKFKITDINSIKNSDVKRLELFIRKDRTITYYIDGHTYTIYAEE